MQGMSTVAPAANEQPLHSGVFPHSGTASQRISLPAA